MVAAYVFGKIDKSRQLPALSNQRQTMIRVRQLLSDLNSVETSNLKKLLPKGVATAVPAEPDGVRYPAALLSLLPKDESYSLAGHITEAMLRLSPAEINVAALCRVSTEWSPGLDLVKLTKSKTTEPYLEHLRRTSEKMRAVAVGSMEYDVAVEGDGVEGHPDARTATQIFEVKMTGQLKKNWVDFLFQTFAYAALTPATVTHIYIVLPLQEIVWAYDVRGWAHRATYRAFLEETATKKRGPGRDAALALIERYHIGSHMPKARTLVATVASLPLDRPSQIFLSGPQTAQMRLDDRDLDAACASLAGRALFIHSQYIINLCTPAGTQDDIHTNLLIANLVAGRRLGARGVVVHVGKSTTQEPSVALEHMRKNLTRAIAYATEECPILLETPSGQGTEMLCDCDEFLEFVRSFGPRLRACVDTCHVFAAGDNPVNYLHQSITADADLTRLIHFNDSATACGSCLDRHAFCGEGHIGLAVLTDVAERATAVGIPMVIE